MKYRLVFYAFILTVVFNYVMGLRMGISLNEAQARLDARRSAAFVMESKLLKSEMNDQDCVAKSLF